MKKFVDPALKAIGFLFIVLIFFSTQRSVAQITQTQLFQNTYQVWELMRNDKGVYRDSKVFTGSDFHPCSTANIGIGLISLCIADRMGWITDAQSKIITTLRTVSGQTPGFRLDVNAFGFPRHFVDMNTGAQAWSSEYSTIDAALMVTGALFCKKYFSANTTITQLTDQLFNSMNWSRVVADPSTGALYLTMNAQGVGQGTIRPYNEYYLLAYLAYKAENGVGGPATNLWNKFYANTTNLPKSNYWGNEVLTDNPGGFLSDFIPQFCYYLNNAYMNNTSYGSYMTNAMNADKLWFNNSGPHAAFEWGLGAGVSDSYGGYHADKVDENVSRIVSPHIIAGFIPINSASGNDLMSLYSAGKGIYTFAANNKSILWRYSLSNSSWRANAVQGIDFSSMLFGLASLSQHCGIGFFSTNNNYSFPYFSYKPFISAFLNQTVTLKGNNNLYVSSENGQTVMHCNRSSASDWEKFLIVDAGGGKIGLKSMSKFVSSENGVNYMTCNRTAMGDWEKFDLIIQSGTSISFRGNNLRYVSSENGARPMTCYWSNITSWERFVYTIVPPVPTNVRTQLNTDEVVLAEEGQMQNEEVDIYPTMAQEEINVHYHRNHSINTSTKVQLINSSGQEIFTEADGDKEHVVIPVKEIKGGVYVVRVQTGLKTFVKRVVIYK